MALKRKQYMVREDQDEMIRKFTSIRLCSESQVIRDALDFYKKFLIKTIGG